MPTECSPTLFEFAPVEGRQVVAGLDGGAITSDAGALLLSETDRSIQLTARFARRHDMAYVMLCALRHIGLAHTQFAEATCGTICLKLLKLGALVRISVRRIKCAIASACPWPDEFALAHARLRYAAA